MGTGKLLLSELVFFLLATGCHSQDEPTLSWFLIWLFRVVCILEGDMIIFAAKPVYVTLREIVMDMQ